MPQYLYINKPAVTANPDFSYTINNFTGLLSQPMSRGVKIVSAVVLQVGCDQPTIVIRSTLSATNVTAIDFKGPVLGLAFPENGQNVLAGQEFVYRCNHTPYVDITQMHGFTFYFETTAGVRLDFTAANSSFSIILEVI